MTSWHPLMFISLIVLIIKSTNHSLLLLCCQVADRLFSSFGQDILDALYWTATEPKEKKRAHIGVIPHFFMAVLYVCILTEKDVIFINSLFILLLLCASVLEFRRNRGQKSLSELRQWVGCVIVYLSILLIKEIWSFSFTCVSFDLFWCLMWWENWISLDFGLQVRPEKSYLKMWT